MGNVHQMIMLQNMADLYESISEEARFYFIQLNGGLKDE